MGMPPSSVCPSSSYNSYSPSWMPALASSLEPGSNEHVTALMKSLHWLRFPARIMNKVAVLTFQYLQGTVPEYVSANLHHSQRPVSQSSVVCIHPELVVPRTPLLTTGDRAFLAAASRIWNSLPSDITSTETLQTFKNRLKTHLFRLSYS
jgi:hypothetical protein